MNILLFDDHILFGESIKKLLEEDENIDNCYYVNNESGFYQILNNKKIDIILLDINLKDNSNENGIDLMKSILESDKNIKIIILSSYDLPVYKKLSYNYGASAFVNKSINFKELINTIIKVNKGNIIRRFEGEDEILTDREIEIIRELCSGKSRKDIADKLYISERTLYNHIQNIYEKLEVNNGIEAFDKALKLGYLEPKI